MNLIQKNLLKKNRDFIELNYVREFSNEYNKKK